MNDAAVIAIGRNEGERLHRCLLSSLASGCQVVYVDSGSSDASVELARSMGAQVVELDMSVPFSAARARNAGFDRLNANIRYVQFVDGDCEIVAGWIERARRELESRPDVAVVCGRRRERFPEMSIYNRMANLEWDTPVGDVQSCGGDAMMRAEAFRNAGGFDPSVVAGEEPELCQRLRRKGWKILRIDAEMTLHDSAMLSFRQWWRRAVRSGYGSMDIAARFGSDGLFTHQVRSTRIWVYAWPGAVLLGSVVADVLFGHYVGAMLAVALILVLPAQMLRLGMRARSRTGSISDAMAFGVLTMLSKWPDALGQIAYRKDRRAGRLARLIEYKQGAPHMAPVASS